MAEPFSTIAAALPYGWQVVYMLKVEGIPYLLTEKALFGLTCDSTEYTCDTTLITCDSTSAYGITGYTSHECLVIDDSAKIGSQIDHKSGISKSYDLTVHIRRTSTTETLFQAPSNITALAADLDYDDTTSITVEDSSGFDASGTVYIGREAIDYASKADGTHFNTLSRGEPNSEWRGYDHTFGSGVSTWVTDSPLFWRGREVILYAIPVDPYGVDSKSVTSMIWRGHIQTKPLGHSDGWTLQCRSYERRLSEKIGVKASGTGHFSYVADPIVEAHESYTIQIGFDVDDDNADEETFSLQPFAGEGDWTGPLSVVRSKIAASFVTASTAAANNNIGTGFKWEQTTESPPLFPNVLLRRWLPKYEGSGLGTDKIHIITTFPQGYCSGIFVDWAETSEDHIQVETFPSVGWIELPFFAEATAVLGAITVTLYNDDPSALPSSGYVVIEASDAEWLFEYDSVTQGGAGTGTDVTFILAKDQPGLSAVISQLAADGEQDFSVQVLSMFGPDTPQVIMREILMSSGRGNNDATYDSGIRGTGYDLRSVQTASWDDELDAEWILLGDQQYALDDRFSFADVYGDMLALSQRAVALRPNVSGSDIELEVIRTSLGDTGLAEFEINDTHLLIAGEGSMPVREVTPPRGPNEIMVRLEEVAGQKNGSIVVNDVTQILANGAEPWKMKSYGIPRKTMAPIVSSWAQSRFMDDTELRVFEVDVVPWLEFSNGYPVRIGDSVRWNTSHFLAWDPSTGQSGFNGPARVWGIQTRLRDYHTTLTLAIAGITTQLSLAPSAEVDAYGGLATDPDWVEIHVDYVDLFTEFKRGETDFDVIVYQRSLDDPTTDGYTISAVASVGGACRLTVDSTSGAPDLSSGTWYLTIPRRQDSNDAQQKHLHIDSPGAAWG